MNYIINPSWFYWLGVVKSMRGFMLAAFIDFADPETGRKVGVDAYFEEVDGKWQEIGKRKWYTLRKKHGERLAAILKAKEE